MFSTTVGIKTTTQSVGRTVGAAFVSWSRRLLMISLCV